MRPKTFGTRMGAILNRALSTVSYRMHVAAANVWRDGYNPLRSLTIMRAVHLLEEGERGAFADLQWTYRYIEMQDATLGALVERRTSAIQELDWDIKVRAKIPAGKEAVAARQAEALTAAYEKIGNLSAAFEHMAMATFRGFCRLEKVTDESGDVIELAPVDQWFWVRRGLYGKWQLNRETKFGVVDGEDVPEPRFVCREVSRPVNRVALIAFVRKSLSQKDWDGFIETYGIPAVFIVMPGDVPPEKSEEYLEMADQVTGDARGVLPNGSEVKTVDNGARGVNPFKDHIAYQDEQVVLRGTGGKLTMLAESGSGTLAGGAHSDTFAAIARAEAAEISEIFRKALDAEIIERVTPGEAAYAYFQLAANEETDPGQVVEDIAKLEAIGLQVDAKWIMEKTGYPVTRPSMPGSATEEIYDDDLDDEEDPLERIINRGGGAPKLGGPKKGGKARKTLVRGSSATPTGSGMGFDPNQKRIPKGQANAGRWTDDGIVSKGQRATRGVMRPATAEDRKRLKIPPGYKDAKVTDDSKADLVATAINPKGKPISIYAESYTKKQEAAKFGRISALNKEMPALQARIAADAASGNHQALTMRLVTISGMRNGGEKGGGKVATFGASNLKTSQVRVEGDTIHMDFVGKKGVRQRHSVKDSLLAKHVSERISSGRETVFDGNAGKTLSYLKDISGDKFKVHDFRTWNASITADRTISRIQAKAQLPANETEYKAFQMRVARVVSRKLGNDPAMALKAYIHPAVFNGY